MTDADRNTKRVLASVLRRLADDLEDELAEKPPTRGPAQVKPATRAYSDTAKAKARAGLRAG